MNVKNISTFLALTLASMAYGFIVDLPKVSTVGPMVTDEIKVAHSGSARTRLSLSFGAGQSQSGDTYTQEGAGHTLTFIVTTDVGTLTLTK